MPHPIDIHVGNRIRSQRQVLSLSQEKLGNMLGISFQQVQKYEKGANRVGSSRLYELSQALQVPVSWFFEGLDSDNVTPLLPTRRSSMEMGALIDNLPNEVRKSVIDLIRALDRGTRAAAAAE